MADAATMSVKLRDRAGKGQLAPHDVLEEFQLLFMEINWIQR